MRIYIAEDDPSVIGVLEDILESSALGRVCGASEEGNYLQDLRLWS